MKGEISDKNKSIDLDDKLNSCTVIYMSPRRENREVYRRELEKTLKQMEEFSGFLHNQSVQLAMNGPWKEWSDRQAIGSSIYIDRAMMMNTGDHTITAIMVLHGHLCDVLNFLRDQK
jgi:hypothetical protein